jgi:CXXC-20-CXXC protein
MNIRTCPHCNYKYSIPEYLNQVISRFRSLGWNCKNCNKKITFDYTRRLIVGLSFFGVYAIIYSLRNLVGMTPFRWAALLTFYIGASFFIFTFDTFQKAE